MRRIMGRCSFLLLMLAIGAAVLFPPDKGAGGPPLPTLQTILDRSFAGNLERYATERLPGRDSLLRLRLNLLLAGGEREQNGVFITDGGLMKNIDPPTEWYVERNIEAVQQFAREAGVNTCLALIPTASAIRQSYLPPYASSGMFNQRQFIEDTYNRLSGRVTVADVYSVLFDNREQYVYYRTENNITALGGYYVFTALGTKLGIEDRSMSQFDISYAGSEYYGDLYRSVPYQNVAPDVLSLYGYSLRYSREYTVQHYRGGRVEKTFHTLYPAELSKPCREMDIYLGGLSAVVDIRISSPYTRDLLVFGDRTALSYLPFLANSCRRVTLVDLFQLTAEDYPLIQPEDYTHVLFAYGVESFAHTDQPRRALQLLPD